MITSPGVNNLGILSSVIRDVFTLLDASRMLIVVVMVSTVQSKNLVNGKFLSKLNKSTRQCCGYVILRDTKHFDIQLAYVYVSHV